MSIDDSYLQDIKIHFKTAIQFINKALKEDDKNRVYLHCFAGISRSSTIAIAYLMNTKKMNYKNAYELVKSKREAIEPNKGFQSVAFKKALWRQSLKILKS